MDIFCHSGEGRNPDCKNRIVAVFLHSISFRKIILLVIALGMLFPSTVVADILIKNMTFLNGKCVSAKLNGKDLSEQCKKAKATHTIYQNGWAAFGFIFPDAVSFSGTKELRPSQNEYVLEIKKITIILQGKPFSAQAMGSCSVSGDITKLATITCDASFIDKKDHYLVVFEGNMNEDDTIYGRGFEPQNPEVNIRSAIRTFDRIYTSSGIDGVQRHLETCYPEAATSRWLPAIINCASIDFAGNHMDMVVVKLHAKSPRPYFTEEATNQRVKQHLLDFSGGSNNDKLETISQSTKNLAIKTLRELIQSKSNKDIPSVNLK
jgi:hypothetical protein